MNDIKREGKGRRMARKGFAAFGGANEQWTITLVNDGMKYVCTIER